MTQEQKQAYLKELGIRLKYFGFRTTSQEDGALSVAKYDKNLCEITDTGCIRFHPESLTKEEEELVRGMVKDESTTVLEYMRLMAQAPKMNTGNEVDYYKMLADFNGAVLAGHETSLGVQFVTWEWDQDRKGVHWGHYYGQN